MGYGIIRKEKLLSNKVKENGSAADNNNNLRGG
jgi:hypothetical protein